jgi:hypothetical protein
LRTDVGALLESERALEREFASSDHANPAGWSVATTMFHLVNWRELLIAALEDLRDGRTPAAPPADVDEFNDARLARAAQVALDESAARADALLISMRDLYDAVGEQPIKWYTRKNTAEAILGNSYTHPRFHLTMYWRESGEPEKAREVLEASVAELIEANAPKNFVHGLQYNLACVLVSLDRNADALDLLSECLPEHDQLRAAAPNDPDLAPLRDEPRFKALTSD